MLLDLYFHHANAWRPPPLLPDSYFREVPSTPRRRIEPQPWQPDEEDEAILLAVINH